MRIACGCVLLSAADLQYSHYSVKARLFERDRYTDSPPKSITPNVDREAMRGWRAKLDVGQRELARMAGVSQGRITWAENKGWASDVTASALRRLGFEGIK